MAAVVAYLGGDGSAWNLTTGYEGVTLLGDVLGLADPEFDAHWTERISDGDRYRGSRTRRRTISFKVGVGQELKGQAWRDLDAAWWRSLSPDVAGLFDIRTENLEHRYLAVRLDRATGKVYSFDPGVGGIDTYLITLVADDPYFLGEDITNTWTYAPTGENFYGGATGLATPYVISPSGAFGSALVTNAGDVPAWPRWRITGPASSVLLTVDGQSVAYPASIPASTYIDILTDPPDVFDHLLASQWENMTGVQDFAPVPVGATVEVAADVTGAGTGTSVTMTITPRYKRAW